MKTRFYDGLHRYIMLFCLSFLIIQSSAFAQLGAIWTQLLPNQVNAQQPTILGEAAELNGVIYAISYGQVYQSVDGGNFELILDNAPWNVPNIGAIEPGPTLNAFNGKLWRIGRPDVHFTYCSVWSSPDGLNWTEALYPAPFFARQDHAVTVHNGKLWLVGGRTGAVDQNNYLSEDASTTLMHDVWSSADGVNWALVNGSPAFEERYGHQLVSFDGKLWLIGGHNGVTEKNDIWSSEDGVTWNLMPSTGQLFIPRFDHQAIFYNNQLWMIGGRNNGIGYNNTIPSSLPDVWNTSDGISWARVEANSEMGRLSGHNALVFNNALLVTGNNPYLNPSGDRTNWSSSNGLDWTPLNRQSVPDSEEQSTAVYYNGKIWWFLTSPTSGSREVWTSANGVNWQIVSANVPGRGQDSTVFNNRIYVMGKTRAGEFTVDSTTDGINWKHHGMVYTWLGVGAASVPHPGIPRFGAIGTDLFVVLGRNYLWKLPDYFEYSVIRNPSDSGLGALSAPVVSFNNKLWTLLDDTLYSLQIAPLPEFEVVSSGLPFSKRESHEMAVCNGRMYVIGGRSTIGPARPILNDVWSSADGRGWVRETASGAFSVRLNPAAASTADSIYLIGGQTTTSSNEFLNDVWVSTASGPQPGKAAAGDWVNFR